MERKVGEIFDFEGKKLKVEIANEIDWCEGCFFYDKKCNDSEMENILGSCLNRGRKDSENVIFKDITDMEYGTEDRRSF